MSFVNRETLGLLGFLLVATAQVSNMILARGLAGSVPPFALAFFRWSIVIHLIGGALSLGGMWLSLRDRSGGPGHGTQ